MEKLISIKAWGASLTPPVGRVWAYMLSKRLEPGLKQKIGRCIGVVDGAPDPRKRGASGGIAMGRAASAKINKETA